MLHSTRGIILSKIPYGEKGLIVKSITRELGPLSFLVHSPRSRKSGLPIHYLFPLSLVDLVVEVRAKRSLQNIREIKASHPCPDIRDDIRKTCLSQFLSELILRGAQEEERNENLYDFLEHQILGLESSQTLQWYSHRFLLQFSKFLGFFPDGSGYEVASYLDLEEGKFFANPQSNHHYADVYTSEAIYRLLNGEMPDASKISQRAVLDEILKYFRLHLPAFDSLKSRAVLEDIFYV